MLSGFESLSRSQPSISAFAVTDSDSNSNGTAESRAPSPAEPEPRATPARVGIPAEGARLWLIRLGWATLLLATVLVLFAASFYTTMRLVLGGREVITPDLTGMTIEEAEGALLASELHLETVSERYDNQFEKDRITAQEPLPGETLKRNRKIRITLSLGPLEIPIPDVRGQTLRSAELALRRDGLDVGHVAYTHLGDAAPDVVVAQEPLPGAESSIGELPEEVDAEGRIALLVSRGVREDVFIMPDLTRRSLDDVEALAARTGLRIGAVRRQKTPGFERGRVVRQYPQAGYPVGRRDIISLVLSE